MGSILNSQTDPPTIEHVDFMKAGARFLKKHHFRSKDGFGSAFWLPWAPFGGSWGLFGASGSTTEGFQIPLKTLLGLACSPESLAKLPFGVLRAFWDRHWLVFRAPEGLYGGVLASVKPISTIKTALPSFDTVFSLAVVVEFINSLMIIIVEAGEIGELQKCPTVELESFIL